MINFLHQNKIGLGGIAIIRKVYYLGSGVAKIARNVVIRVPLASTRHNVILRNSIDLFCSHCTEL